jgi:DNA-binding transcriptional LysR family regulator
MSQRLLLGAVEEVAGDTLPPALGRFARQHPDVRLEVQVGVSAELIAQIDAGTLDVVFAKRPWGTSRGRLVWREPLVGAAADTFELVPGASLPLALYRAHSVSREAALEPVRDSERAWHIVYTSPSLTGVRAAALAGLAVTPLPASAVGRGLRILDEKDGMSPLPDLDFAIFERARAGPAAAALAEALALLRPARAPARA